MNFSLFNFEINLEVEIIDVFFSPFIFFFFYTILHKYTSNNYAENSWHWIKFNYNNSNEYKYMLYFGHQFERNKNLQLQYFYHPWNANNTFSHGHTDLCWPHGTHRIHRLQNRQGFNLNKKIIQRSYLGFFFFL